MNVLGCGGPKHSGVYAEVETVLNWVKENSGSNCGESWRTKEQENDLHFSRRHMRLVEKFYNSKVA